MRTFTPADQEAFARISGDHNEMHMDPVLARRTLAGRQVVHGVHTVMWALDTCAAMGAFGIDRLTARFPKPVFLHEQVTASGWVTPADASVTVSVEGMKAVEISLITTDATAGGDDRRRPLSLPESARELTMDDIRNAEGTLPVPADDGAFAATFPDLVAGVGAVAAAQLAAMSRLVGMVCPGRHSVLSGFDLSATPDGSSDSVLWRVSRADERVGAVRLDITGGRWTGTVDAFLRPPPAGQPTILELASLVTRGEFEDQAALVVGGSRGLGEVTSKLIAAGGGDVVLTWQSGRSDARRVVSEIVDNGGRAAEVHLDVSDPLPALHELNESGWSPRQIYFFASPKIFDRRSGLLTERLLDVFVATYVTGLGRLIEACRTAGSEDLTVFYPSSVAIDEEGSALTEYAVAKAAGETFVRILARNNRWLDVIVARLPRLPTDQTNSLISAPSADTASLMLAMVRDVQARHPASGL